MLMNSIMFSEDIKICSRVPSSTFLWVSWVALSIPSPSLLVGLAMLLDALLIRWDICKVQKNETQGLGCWNMLASWLRFSALLNSRWRSSSSKWVRGWSICVASLLCDEFIFPCIFVFLFLNQGSVWKKKLPSPGGNQNHEFSSNKYKNIKLKVKVLLVKAKIKKEN